MAAYKARLSPTGFKSSDPATDIGHDLPLPLSPEQTLLSISADAREAVLANLNAAELCQCQLVCRALRVAATADSLWRRLCVQKWPETDTAAWLSPHSTGSIDCDNLGDDASFSNYRQLYPALLRYGTITGIWRQPAGDTISLYRIRWGRSCIEGSRLVYGTEPSGTGLTDSRTIFGKDSVVRVEHLTANECTLAVPRLAPQHKSPSQGAQAAAAVATNLVRMCALE
jgi:F-box-like